MLTARPRLRTDSTRIATFISAEVHGPDFSFIPGVTGASHISHPATTRQAGDVREDNTWHVAQYAICSRSWRR